MSRTRLCSITALVLAGISTVPFVSEGQEAPGAQEATEPETPDAQEQEQAENEHLARQFFETGRVYFERAQYERAAEAFEEAYQRSGRPSLLVNVARSQEALGRNVDAVATLERALADLPEESDLGRTIEARLTRLRAQVEREAAASAEQEAAAESGETTHVPDVRVETANASDADARDDVMWWSGVAAVAVGGVALAASLGTGIASSSVHNQLEEDCPERVCSPENADDIDRGKGLAVASTVLLVVGAGASVAGALLMWLSLDAESAEDDGVAVTAGPGLVGAGLQGRF